MVGPRREPAAGRADREVWDPPATLDDVVAKLSGLWDEHGMKVFRYCGVSVFNVLLGQSLLALFVLADVEVLLANLLAVGIGTIPAYWMARRYVWEKTGRHSIRREVLPFWVLNFMGLLLSSMFTSLAHRWWGSTVLLINAASLAAWFAVWVLKYVTLDKAVFRAQLREETRVTAA